VIVLFLLVSLVGVASVVAAVALDSRTYLERGES
jgi:hypothetical protein